MRVPWYRLLLLLRTCFSGRERRRDLLLVAANSTHFRGLITARPRPIQLNASHTSAHARAEWYQSSSTERTVREILKDAQNNSCQFRGFRNRLVLLDSMAEQSTYSRDSDSGMSRIFSMYRLHKPFKSDLFVNRL